MARGRARIDAAGYGNRLSRSNVDVIDGRVNKSYRGTKTIHTAWVKKLKRSRKAYASAEEDIASPSSR